MSRQETGWPKRSNKGWVRPIIQAIEASNARRVSNASARPICLARFCCSAGNLPARIAIKSRLSIPSTISRPVSVKRLAQISGSIIQSIATLTLGCPPQDRPQFAALASGLSYLPMGFGGGVVELRTEFRLGNGDAPVVEVGPHLIDDVRIARCFEVCFYDGLGITLCLLAARQAQSRGRPQPEQPIASGGDPEPPLLIALEL